MKNEFSNYCETQIKTKRRPSTIVILLWVSMNNIIPFIAEAILLIIFAMWGVLKFPIILGNFSTDLKLCLIYLSSALAGLLLVNLLLKITKNNKMYNSVSLATLSICTFCISFNLSESMYRVLLIIIYMVLGISFYRLSSYIKMRHRN